MSRTSSSKCKKVDSRIPGEVDERNIFGYFVKLSLSDM